MFQEEIPQGAEVPRTAARQAFRTALLAIKNETLLRLGPLPSTQTFLAFQERRLTRKKAAAVQQFAAVIPELFRHHHPGGLGEELGSERAQRPVAEADVDRAWQVFRRRLEERKIATPSPSQLETAVAEITRLLAKVQAERLKGPERDGIRPLVEAVNEGLEQLDRAAALTKDQDRLIRRTVLQASFPLVALIRSGESGLAAQYLLDQWKAVVETLTSRTLKVKSLRRSRQRMAPALRRWIDPEKELEFLTTFHAVVFEVLQEEEARAGAQRILERLRVYLRLGPGQLGRMFGVPATVVKKWQAGSTPIPDRTMPALEEAESALDVLLEKFLPERLPLVIRRPVELFGGQTALHWILSGRIRDVARKYDLLLHYQP